MVNHRIMDRVAARKYHVAPLERQRREVERLLRAGRFKNATEFIRAAIDHYLERLGRPSLSEQAAQMADDWEAGRGVGGDVDAEQDRSRAADERW